jgi:AraC-like DNA-binding protein
LLILLSHPFASRRLEACAASDQNAFQQCLLSDKLNTFTCYSGLTESAISLKYHGVIVGYIMFGQITQITDKDERFKKLAGSLKGIDLTETARRKMTDSLICQNEEQIQAASTILLTLGKYAISAKLFSVNKEEFISKADRIIDAKMEEALSAKDLAKKMGLSRTKLYNMSKEYLKTGPAEYISQRKLEKACQLLIQTEESVSDIASAVGFADYNYFERVFKKKKGASATKYRKEYHSDLH